MLVISQVSPTSLQKSPRSYNFGVRSFTLPASYTLHRHHQVPVITNLLEYIVFVEL